MAGPFLPNFGGSSSGGTSSIGNGATTNTVNISNATANYFNAPAGALAYLIQTDSGNPEAMRYRPNGAAGASIGHQLEAGRDTGYIPWNGITLSVSNTTSGNTCSVQITWFTLI